MSNEMNSVKGTEQPTRREMLALMTAFAAMAGVDGALAQATPSGVDLAHAKVFRFADLKEHKNDNGGWSRAVVEGALPSGEWIELHQSMVPPGKMPHPPHKHSNSEFIVLREGTIQYLRDGSREELKPGDVIYTASLQPHGMLNTGTVNAVYFVLSVGKKDAAVFVDLKGSE
ncbi:Cupin domain-containing protein [Bryocella elongata]|uniref:Cupin domain-containing protein n=1 Tax=Bryocella elongata TaxID=863522 RepID=A0A1H5SCC1_9BACT|nr:cupin domain-containing protein [Bryocella elongata]SEF48246.1 Cupin domain-containing protein [Bryocella elongata]